MPAPLDLTGQKYGRLTVVALTPDRIGGCRVYQCQCECGVFTKVSTTSLRSGNTRSCGCLARERIAEVGRTKSDHSKTHGLWRHPLYQTWYTMRQRCRYPKHVKWAQYGGRGIRVCDRWQGPDGFPNFLADMGEKPGPGYTLDRIDVDGPYSPENCRWATHKEQRANRRR